MSSSRCFIALALCLLQVLDSTNAFHKRNFMSKRFNFVKQSDRPNKEVEERPQKSEGNTLNRAIVFTDISIEGETEGIQYGSIALNCEAGGIPAPRFHWLKDGKRISQSGVCGSSAEEETEIEDLNSGSGTKLSLYTTLSTLYLDCLDEMDAGNYTCVAETPTSRSIRSTLLTVESVENPSIDTLKKCAKKAFLLPFDSTESVENPSIDTLKKCAKKGKPAKIYMQTVNVFEYEGNAVQFFCRASGNPTPKITWYDMNNETIQDGGHYRITRNGDLIIKDISWFDHMGVYTCEASNKFGSDRSAPFLYPTGRSETPLRMV
ncbi:neural/ectodermal development factor imp-l2 [Plakobranchus ocellatus]|uniref:Neural/ectodermal development factor imp-l2 n=1 Tax=Plakobranchus ocellatus TaxID=259542 RepID=A0AAV4BCD9_9GAST|nr:neural/ectodermal development factor imp-l2 [Plakobranchus ocellatus]